MSSLWGLSLLLVAFLHHTWGEEVGTLVVFGDSLSDNGNGSWRIHKAFFQNKDAVDAPLNPPSPPYYQGRFSNGPVWAELAASQLGLRLQDFAVGGSGSGGGAPHYFKGNYTASDGSEVAYSIPIPSALDQARSFVPDPNPDTQIAVIWTGGNDYFSDRTPPTAVVGAIKEAVDLLSSKGIKRFILMTSIPPFMQIPMPDAKGGEDPGPDIAQIFRQHNQLLKSYAENEFPKSHPDSSIYVFDAAGLWSDISSSARALGFTQSGPCLTGFPPNTGTPCSDPDAHLLWDQAHPTAAAHALLGKRFADAVQRDVIAPVKGS
eukprot:jgi/Botrbrau1/13493/Bobra.0082s0088.1